MQTKHLPAFILPVAAIAMVFVPLQSAQGAATASLTTISMQGQGAIVGNYAQPELRLKFSAADGGGWLLEMALDPAQSSMSGSGLNVLGLDGTFVLGLVNMPLSNGTATGTMDQSGRGDIKMSDPKTSTSLDVPFSIGVTGSITADVSGQWPTVPTAQTTASQLVNTQPANHFFWYLSRAAALVSYILLFLSMCLGVAFKSRRPRWGGGRWQVLDLHKFLAVLGMAFIGLHIFSLLGDSYFHFTPSQLLVPMASPYRPLPITLGIIAFYAAVIAAVTWFARRYIGGRAWRVFHSLAVLVFVLGLIHGVASGTDTSSLWVQLLYAVTGAITVFIGLSQLGRLLSRPKHQAAETG